MSQHRKIEIGQKYERLTVVEYLGQCKHGKSGTARLFRCRCDCGNMIDVPATQIGRAQKSCGCLQKESRERPIASGTRIGRLTVLERDDRNQAKSYYYLCQCDCGKQISVRGDALRAKTTLSCGCLKNEMFTQNRLQKYQIENIVLEGAVNRVFSDVLPRHNTSGHIGVGWHKARQKWYARIRFRGVNYSLGYYDKYNDAVEARETAEKALYDDFIKWYAEAYPERLDKIKRNEET